MSAGEDRGAGRPSRLSVERCALLVSQTLWRKRRRWRWFKSMHKSFEDGPVRFFTTCRVYVHFDKWLPLCSFCILPTLVKSWEYCPSIVDLIQHHVQTSLTCHRSYLALSLWGFAATGSGLQVLISFFRSEQQPACEWRGLLLETLSSNQI